MKTLKWEEIYTDEYRDLEHLVESIEEFIEHYYNRCRLHSALGYLPPEEFEEDSRQRNGEASFAASALTFVRVWQRPGCPIPETKARSCVI